MKRPTKYRTCVICGEQFEVGQKNGTAKTCGPEHSAELARRRGAAWAREAYEADPEKFRAIGRARYATDPEPFKARVAAVDPETKNARWRDWRSRNRDRRNARLRELYAAKKAAANER